MAENKKSFVLYADLIHTVKKMPKEKAGELLLTILAYVNDENPVVEDLTVDLVFEPIKRQMKRDLEKWDNKVSRKSEAGKVGGIKSGEARRQKALEIQARRSGTLKNEAERTSALKNEANEAVTDNVTVTVNVNDIGIDTHKPAGGLLVGPEHMDLELTDVQVGACIEYMKITKQRTVAKETILGLWGVFKVKEFSHHKWRNDISDTYTHFLNTLKFEKLEDLKPEQKQNGLSINERIKATLEARKTG